MPIYDLQCQNQKCLSISRDVWLNVKDIHDQTCPCCGGGMEVMIHAVGMVWGDSSHDPGVIRQAEMRFTDRDGKEHIVDMRDQTRGPKGKLSTPWDGKKVSPKEAEAIGQGSTSSS
jgi:predicted nucleic acid-binding Zn ribbon protein